MFGHPLFSDELGRLRLARQLETTVSDPATAAADETAGIKMDTKYVHSTNRNETWVSNPYRNSETTARTRGWTIKRLNKVGRVRDGGADRNKFIKPSAIR